MIRLENRLPDSVRVRGRKIKLDLDFRNVLKMMEILQDDSLMPEARVYLAVKCVAKCTRHPAETLRAIQQVLEMDRPTEGASMPRITDFHQDAALIRTAFRQTYGINLFTAKLHWLEFSELLNDLPEGSRYIEIVGIRARPVPAPTKYNQKERNWLIKAKAAHALKRNAREQEDYYNNAVKGVFSSLLKLANGGDGNK